MRRSFYQLCLAVFVLLTATLLPASVQKIGPNLYAYISENDASANSTFLISSQGILIVDTGLDAVEGRKLLDEIRRISPQPVRYIVNTHYHRDHRGGNSVFGPDVVIISTYFTRQQVLGSEPGESKKEEQDSTKEYVLNEVVNGRLKLFLGGHEIQIYDPGWAHTQGDLVVYFPEDRAIATGDLFLTNSCPAMDRGDLENWIKALDHILTLPVDHVVPGHFELATKTQLGRFRNYLAELRDQVARMYRNGFSLDRMKKALRFGNYTDFRQFPRYEATFADNAAAYYGQLERNRPRLR